MRPSGHLTDSKARSGMARRGWAWQAMASYGLACIAIFRNGSLWLVRARIRVAWQADEVGDATVWLSRARSGEASSIVEACAAQVRRGQASIGAAGVRYGWLARVSQDSGLASSVVLASKAKSLAGMGAQSTGESADGGAGGWVGSGVASSATERETKHGFAPACIGIGSLRSSKASSGKPSIGALWRGEVSPDNGRGEATPLAFSFAQINYNRDSRSGGLRLRGQRPAGAGKGPAMAYGASLSGVPHA